MSTCVIIGDLTIMTRQAKIYEIIAGTCRFIFDEVISPIEIAEINVTGWEKYGQAMDRIVKTDLVIVEVTEASCETGMQLQQIKHLDKPIILIKEKRAVAIPFLEAFRADFVEYKVVRKNKQGLLRTPDLRTNLFECLKTIERRRIQ